MQRECTTTELVDEIERLRSENAELRATHAKFREWHSDAMWGLKDALEALVRVSEALSECPICQAPKGTGHGASCMIERARYTVKAYWPTLPEGDE